MKTKKKKWGGVGNLKFSRELVKRKQKTNIQIHLKTKYCCERLELGLQWRGEREGPRELQGISVMKDLFLIPRRCC